MKFDKLIEKYLKEDMSIIFYKSGNRKRWSDDMGNAGDATDDAPIGKTLPRKDAVKYQKSNDSNDQFMVHNRYRQRRFRKQDWNTDVHGVSRKGR